MVKRNKIFIIVLMAVISINALPLDISAKTIQQFEQEVEKYTQELQEKKNNLAKNDQEAAQIVAQIASTEKEINACEDEIDRLQKEIEESEIEIAKKSEESKNILSYYQISNGENSYLEYAFGANDITDMIYRLSIVEQLTEYNDRIMKELEELIKKNQQQQQELEQKQEELRALKERLRAEKARIDADSDHIRESMPSIENQIKAAKESVEYYKKLGCGATEDIQQCEYRIAQSSSASSLPSVGFFSRPMDNGYITRGKSSVHLGYDLSSDNKAIPIYPIAPGIVHTIYVDDCTSGRWCRDLGFYCQGNAKIIVVKHNYNGGFIYSSYVHLSAFGNISEGQYVSRDTIIGYMGTTGCSTGPHLHLEMATCFWKKGGCSSYNQYLNNVVNPSNYITIPSSWSNR